MDSYTFSSVNVSNITVGGNRERGMPPFFLIGNASISGMLNLIGDINIVNRYCTYTCEIYTNFWIYLILTTLEVKY